jgi:hypothetical protein
VVLLLYAKWYLYDKNKDNEIGRDRINLNGENTDICKLLCGKLKERAHLEELAVDGRLQQ